MKRMVFLVALAAGCNAPPPPEAAPNCNPIIGDDCLTPLPSSFHLVTSTTTRTGFRVNLVESTLPVSSNGTATKADRMNALDGFSPATPLVVYFKDGVDGTQLPRPSDPVSSLSAASAVQLIEYESGERVPLFAELDSNALDGERQALLVRPQVRLRPNARYLAALVNLKDRAGKILAPAPFRALRDGTTLSKSLEPLAKSYDEILAALEEAGIARRDLSLAWDFHTASDETATSHLTAMRDEARAMTLGYTIVTSTDTPNNSNLYRRVTATVQVPSYLADDSGKSFLQFDGDGKPKLRTLVNVPIFINIPRCAENATTPLPTVVFGHGLFGNAKDSLAYGALQELSNTLCAVVLATDWIGVATDDVANIANIVASDVNSLYVITDRLQQGHVNAQVMTFVYLNQIRKDAAMKIGARAVADGGEIYYFGVSNGGIQGTAYMALSPEVIRGVLNVPGSVWSLLIFRSTNFNALKPLLYGLLPDPLDVQVVIAASQSEWDYTDPATFGPHLLKDTLGVPQKRILVQESIGDAQVPNLATRILARAIGLQALPLVEKVYGITESAGPLDSAYTQWDSHPTPLPPDYNQPSPRDNGAHGGIQAYGPLQMQIRRFLTPDGKVENTCGGPCSLPTR